jgi:hypothetical protein
LSTQTSPSSRSVKALWVLVAALFSLVVALIAGMLASTTGISVAQSVLYGGGAFAGTMLLCLAVLSALGAI